MLYSSFLRALGPGLIWAYGPEAAAIAVGTTGGGPDIPGSPQMPTLNWEELARDLRLARHFCDQILIHSLEGCVWQGFLHQLRSFEWADVERSPDGAQAAAALRKSLRAALWTSAHPGSCWASQRPRPGFSGAGAANDVPASGRERCLVRGPREGPPLAAPGSCQLTPTAAPGREAHKDDLARAPLWQRCPVRRSAGSGRDPAYPR
jgi:hypothetical protein